MDDGKSLREAALENNIPYSSFRDWAYGKTRSRKRGVKGVLTPAEEAQIVEFLLHVQLQARPVEEWLLPELEPSACSQSSPTSGSGCPCLFALTQPDMQFLHSTFSEGGDLEKITFSSMRQEQLCQCNRECG